MSGPIIKKVLVKVQDNGIGMEEEFIKDIFNRYSMGKNNEAKSNKGTGIGMFVLKRFNGDPKWKCICE